MFAYSTYRMTGSVWEEESRKKTRKCTPQPWRGYISRIDTKNKCPHSAFHVEKMAISWQATSMMRTHSTWKFSIGRGKPGTAVVVGK